MIHCTLVAVDYLSNIIFEDNIMDFATLSEEAFLSGFRAAVGNAIKHTFEATVHKLVQLGLKPQSQLLTSPLAVRTKVNKISWVDFSVHTMQIPQGLIGDLVPYTVLTTNQGYHLVGELKAALNLLNVTLSQLLNGAPVDYNALSSLVSKHVYKQGEFYKSYRELVVDNGLSHASISEVLKSPSEAVQWYGYVKLAAYTFDNSELKEWEALLKTVAVRLDAYVDMLTASTNQTDIVIGRIISQAAYDLADRTTLLSVIAMSYQMNHRSADEFTKKLMKY